MKIKKISFWVIMLFFIVALLSPILSPYDVNDFSFEPIISPSMVHLLGTDEMGHDLFSLLLNGFRITIFIALFAGAGSTLLGSLLAIVAVYFKGIIDKLIVRVSEIFIMIPEIIIILFLATISAPTLRNTLIAIIFFSWSKVFKIVRAKLLSLIRKDKIQYTLLMKGNLFDLSRKIWHDVYPVITTMFILQCSKSALYETTLSYFGIGDPLMKSWGKIIKSAINFEGIFNDSVYTWYLLPPIFCLCTFLICLSCLTFDER